MAPKGAIFFSCLLRGFTNARNKKTPVKVFIVLVAGAGFEPTTFGL
jgi:hypothetical protein